MIKNMQEQQKAGKQVIGIKGLHLQIVVNSTPNWKTNEYIPPLVWTNK